MTIGNAETAKNHNIFTNRPMCLPGPSLRSHLLFQDFDRFIELGVRLILEVSL